jgi:hypothetical protein
MPEVRLYDLNGSLIAIVRVPDSDRAHGAMCWQGRLFVDRVRRGLDFVEVECAHPVEVVRLCGQARGREAGAYQAGQGV